MKTSPLVTFVIFAYNQEKFIHDSIQGALRQTYSPLEIIISDDASTDSTFSIIKHEVAAYRGKHHVRVNRNKKNLGLIAHVNKLFNISTGDLIIASAGDDISFPNRTSEIVKNFISFGKPLLIHSKAYEIDKHGSRLGTEAPNVKLRRQLSLAEACTSDSIYLGASAAWSKELFEKYGNIDYKMAYEDLVLGFRAIVEDSIHYIDKPLLAYRVGGGLCPEIGKSIRISEVLKVRKNMAEVMVDTLSQREKDIRLSNLSKKKKYLNINKKELFKWSILLNLYRGEASLSSLSLENFLLVIDLILHELMFFGRWYLLYFSRYFF
ncbi:glycosyltransferase [Geopsychrobacter electrodiphilus]|uniref:glycosyltransferase n=1 Tax=Geopsychrobacter electrodiphilus TaxID=225196 RepID=UPI0003788EE5|nr:glycosyltransferase [Geopsychrobacter electrodiphilus]